MRKRSMVGLLVGGLMVAMLPGLATAAKGDPNLGRCVSEIKKDVRGIKVGQFEDIILGSDADDTDLENPDGSTLICGFGGNDVLDSPLLAGDVFVGGPGADRVDVKVDGGVFIGGAGDDDVYDLEDGLFSGGSGDDDVLNSMTGGTFSGGPGNDFVQNLNGGFFDGGTGTNIVDVRSAGDCINVQPGFTGGPCPSQ